MIPEINVFFSQGGTKEYLSDEPTRWIPWKKRYIPRKSEVGKYSKKRGYFESETCFPCIVVIAPYPSSFGGVYQPVTTGKRKYFAIRSIQLCLMSHYHSENLTYHFFHGSAQVICTTVVLWQDCTGSGTKKRSYIKFASMHKALKQLL